MLGVGEVRCVREVGIGEQRECRKISHTGTLGRFGFIEHRTIKPLLEGASFFVRQR